jgi:hypothetical protein
MQHKITYYILASRKLASRKQIILDNLHVNLKNEIRRF